MIKNLLAMLKKWMNHLLDLWLSPYPDWMMAALFRLLVLLVALQGLAILLISLRLSR